jgi:2-hydroxychromene-2-carboxylate isomerase
MAQKPKLTLFVDIVSPFAYMAFYVLQRSQAFKQVEITYIPIFLGGVMKACDNRPPIQITSTATHPTSNYSGTRLTIKTRQSRIHRIRP